MFGSWTSALAKTLNDTGEWLGQVASEAEATVFGKQQKTPTKYSTNENVSQEQQDPNVQKRRRRKSSTNNTKPSVNIEQQETIDGFATKKVVTVTRPQTPLLTWAGQGSKFPHGGGLQSIPSQRLFIDANGDAANAFYEVRFHIFVSINKKTYVFLIYFYFVLNCELD